MLGFFEHVPGCCPKFFLSLLGLGLRLGLDPLGLGLGLRLGFGLVFGLGLGHLYLTPRGKQ